MHLEVLDYVFSVRLFKQIENCGFSVAFTAVSRQKILYFSIFLPVERLRKFTTWKASWKRTRKSSKRNHWRWYSWSFTKPWFQIDALYITLHSSTFKDWSNLLSINMKTLLSNLFEKINTQMTEEAKSGQFNRNELF